MKNLILLCFTIFFLNCKTNSPINVKQKISNVDLYIRPDIYTSTRDSLKLQVPLEYTVVNNSNKNYDFFEISLLFNKRKIPITDDFFITDLQNREISRFGLKIKKNDSLRFIIHTRCNYLNISNAKKVFKRYNINKDLEKFRDSVKVTSYKQFRTDFPDVIRELERIPDSLEIKTSNIDDKNFTSKRIKINW